MICTRVCGEAPPLIVTPLALYVSWCACSILTFVWLFISTPSTSPGKFARHFPFFARAGVGGRVEGCTNDNLAKFINLHFLRFNRAVWRFRRGGENPGLEWNTIYSTVKKWDERQVCGEGCEGCTKLLFEFDRRK